MQQMVALRKQWDPDGGRVMGARDNDNVPANTATHPHRRVLRRHDGAGPRTDALAGPSHVPRIQRRAPRPRALIETEDFREEGARRFWDDYSPPYYKAKKGPNDTWKLSLHLGELRPGRIKRYWAYWQNRISNTDPAHSKLVRLLLHLLHRRGRRRRQDSSEVCRVSGKVDAMRLPKEIYFAHRVMQNEQPDLHILGHWKSLGINAKPENGFVFAFPEVYFVPGSLKAVARYGGKIVAEEELSTAGPATQIKLTAIIGPKGLEADGEDVALIDVEVLDAKGQRVPTDDARIEFTISGSGVWRGGYNSGKIESTNNLFLNTELGINRVSVRSTRTAGTITVTASRPGLKSAQVQIVTKPVSVVEGFAAWIPQHLRGPAEE
jgi:beta-galactosidase